ncbi:hypothetical protein HUK65_16575 [Rhodobacteraceae bacterium 2376]|uniref:Uncharacterized protein n=1 Tax=Rhabdonatronobacter sediminivivens TaxID=2743469 RepID=A0A7Z0KZD8_9RHOB|nr:hypothetical protein [Rhabdonatronobacter sediminivivens]NYS26602.1 hypothetical protein [Rhabdonatronobacter sediminivivens]
MIPEEFGHEYGQTDRTTIHHGPALRADSSGTRYSNLSSDCDADGRCMCMPFPARSEGAPDNALQLVNDIHRNIL